MRSEVLAARDALSTAVHRNLSARISARVLELPAWRDANCVLLYISFGMEFDTAQLVSAALTHEKQLYLPRVNRDHNILEIHRVSDPAHETVPGAFGIREPRVECAPADLGKIDFVLVGSEKPIIEGVRDLVEKCSRIGIDPRERVTI